MKPWVKKFVIKVLEFEARMVLKRYHPKIIAITGSVGKTSTKDAIYAVLKNSFFIRKSEKSFNRDIGLTLTILGLPNAWSNLWAWTQNFIKGLWLIIKKQPYPEWLILEVGVGKPRDMQRFTKWLYADIVLITRFSNIPVHVEFFESREELIKEKSNLVKVLKKDGLLILNNDDPEVLSLKEQIKAKTITFGFGNSSTIAVSNYEIFYKNNEPSGVRFKIEYQGNSVPAEINGALGENHIYSALAAMSTSLSLGLNMIESVDALKYYESPPGRMKLIKGIKKSLIIDDSYNSSPVACELALKTLEEIKLVDGRKIAILGDMLELGKFTEESHFNIGKKVAGIVNILAIVGPRSKSIIEGAISNGMEKNNIHYFDDSRDAGKFIKQEIKENDLILVKGSQGVRMERAVQEIMAFPEQREELLVRQDPEWLKRK